MTERECNVAQNLPFLIRKLFVISCLRHLDYFKPSSIHRAVTFKLVARTMSVLLETSLGDITIDLLGEYAPKACTK